MSGDLATAALLKADTATKEATAKVYSPDVQASPLALRAAIAEQGEAARTQVTIQAAARAATPNPMDAPLTDATVGGWADVSEKETRAALVQASQAYRIPAQLLRAAWDDASRMKQIEARGGDAQAEGLRIVHGALGKDAPAALAAAKALVARDPKLRDFLAETGLGNSAWMVRHLAAEARKWGIAR